MGTIDAPFFDQLFHTGRHQMTIRRTRHDEVADFCRGNARFGKREQVIVATQLLWNGRHRPRARYRQQAGALEDALRVLPLHEVHQAVITYN